MQKESRCRRCERTCLTRNGFFSLLTFLLGIAGRSCRSLSLPHTATCRPAGAVPMAERVSSLFQRVQRSMQTHAHALSCPESQHKGAARRPRSVEGHGESPSLQRRFAAGPVPFLLRVTSGGRLSGPGGQELLDEGLSPANRGKSDVRPRHRVSALATAGADG